MDLQNGYAVVDIELTSVSLRRGRIIEIAVGVALLGRDLSIERILVKIDRAIPQRIVELTGITDRDLALGGVVIDDALAWFVETTSGLPIVGHDVFRAERPHLLEAARRHRQDVDDGILSSLSINEAEDLPAARFVDTLALYKGYMLGEYPSAGESHEEYSRRIVALRAHGLPMGLAAACEDLGISASRIRTHRAAGDVLLNHRLFQKLLELNPPE